MVRLALCAALAFFGPFFGSLGAMAETLNIAIVSRTIFYVPLWAAVRAGYMRDEGIEAAIEVYDNAEKINADLLSGHARISISTPESVIVDAYRGGRLRIIAANAERLPHFIIAKPGIKSFQDLRGANFGVLSMQEGTTYLVQELAKAVGLSPSEYKISAVGGAPTRWRLLKEGKIDAGLQPFPLSYQAEAAGFTNLGPISRFVPHYLFTSVNIDNEWGRANPKLVSAFLRALRRGQEFAKQHVKEAAQISAEEMRTTVALAQRALEDTARLQILSPDLSVAEPGLVYVFQSLQSAGLIAPSEMFDRNRAVDETYLRTSRM